MTTVVDELVIKLGLDNTSFRQQITQSQENVRKVSDEAQKQAKLIEAAGDRAASFFTKLRNEALALFALFIGTSSIKNFIQQTTLANAALGQTAKNIGMTTRELSAWQMAAERSQGSAEGLTNSMRSLSQDFQTSLLTGQATQSMNVLAQMGIAVEDPHHPGQMRPIDEIYKDVADRMKGMSAPQQQALGKMLGMDEGTINLIAKGRAEIDKLLEEMRRLGTVSDEDAKVAQDLINSFKGVSDAITDVGRAILRDVSPYLTAVLTGMKDWIVQNKEWLKAEISTKIKEFGDWLKAIDWKQIHKDIDEFLAKVNRVVELLGGWTRITEVLLGLWVGAKFLGAIQNIARLTGAIATNPILMALLGIAAGGYLAYERGTDEAISGKLGFRPSGKPGSVDEAGNVMSWVNPETGETIDAFEMRDRVRKYRETHKESLTEPQAPGATGTLRDALNINQGQYDVFAGRIAGIEHASYGQMGGSSNRFAGRYQMGADEIRETAQSLGEAGPTREQFLADPSMQERYFERYSLNHHNQLMRLSPEYAAMSNEERLAVLGYAHNQGVGGALTWLRTGRAGSDAFGTSGARYATSIREGLRGARTTQANINNRNTTTNNDSNTHINGPINIQTAATDADGIAKGIGPALRKYLPVQEANYGLA